MAHKKGGGTTKKNRDSAGKRLGLKIFGGQMAKAGSIIARQNGSKFHAGIGAEQGRDFTIFATQEGKVQFRTKQGRKYIDITG